MWLPATLHVKSARKTDSIHHHHHHHPEGVVYRSFCLNSSTFAVSEIASRRWWCIESLFPSAQHERAGYINRLQYNIFIT